MIRTYLYFNRDGSRNLSVKYDDQYMYEEFTKTLRKMDSTEAELQIISTVIPSHDSEEDDEIIDIVSFSN